VCAIENIFGSRMTTVAYISTTLLCIQVGLQCIISRHCSQYGSFRINFS